MSLCIYLLPRAAVIKESSFLNIDKKHIYLSGYDGISHNTAPDQVGTSFNYNTM